MIAHELGTVLLTVGPFIACLWYFGSQDERKERLWLLHHIDKPAPRLSGREKAARIAIFAAAILGGGWLANL